MKNVIETLYQSQYNLLATWPMNDPEGLIYAIGKIHEAIAIVRQLEKVILA